MYRKYSCVQQVVLELLVAVQGKIPSPTPRPTDSNRRVFKRPFFVQRVHSAYIFFASPSATNLSLNSITF